VATSQVCERCRLGFKGGSWVTYDYHHMVPLPYDDDHTVSSTIPIVDREWREDKGRELKVLPKASQREGASWLWVAEWPSPSASPTWHRSRPISIFGVSVATLVAGHGCECGSSGLKRAKRQIANEVFQRSHFTIYRLFRSKTARESTSRLDSFHHSVNAPKFRGVKRGSRSLRFYERGAKRAKRACCQIYFRPF